MIRICCGGVCLNARLEWANANLECSLLCFNRTPRLLEAVYRHQLPPNFCEDVQRRSRSGQRNQVISPGRQRSPETGFEHH